MALERLVLLQMQIFVNMIYSILTHGNAIKILHFNHLNCTAIVYNLYRSHCFSKQFMIKSLHKHITTSHIKMIQHRKKTWQRKQHIQRQVLRINNQIAEQELRPWLSDGDSHHLIFATVGRVILYQFGPIMEQVRYNMSV